MATLRHSRSDLAERASWTQTRSVGPGVATRAVGRKNGRVTDLVAETFRERRPSADLVRHVVCVWVQEVAPDSAPYRHRTVPNGSAELVATPGSPLRVRGPQTGPVEQVDAPRSITVGVRLSPTSALAVLGVPPSALLDLEVEANAVWRASTAALDDALASASSPLVAAALVEREVARRLVDAPELDPVATEATRRLGPGGASEVKALARELDMSARQLRRRVEAATGLGPKSLHRVLRFQRFLALASSVDRPTSQLARLAAEAGYADQSHLTREALRLEGLTPGVLLLETEAHCSCAHDHAASYAPLVTSR